MDESLRLKAPKTGIITDAISWKALWKTWRADETMPVINFRKELVIVGTVPGPNQVKIQPKLLDNGDVQFVVAGTKVGGPGFGYLLLKIPRDGIKSINGTPVNLVSTEESIAVTIVGKLTSPVYAIGGETTGTTITAKGITWELDFGDNTTLQNIARKLNGQSVIVQGHLEIRTGIEIRERAVVAVSAFESLVPEPAGGEPKTNR